MSAEVGAWTARFVELFGRIAGGFGRVDLRRCAMDYMRGPLGPVERKNTWQIAEYAGHTGPYRFQNLLGRSGIPTGCATSCADTCSSSSARTTGS